MKPPRLEALVWVLIYGGILALCLGWFIAPDGGPWGELLMTGGMVAAAAGIILIVVRSRM